MIARPSRVRNDPTSPAGDGVAARRKLEEVIRRHSCRCMGEDRRRFAAGRGMLPTLVAYCRLLASALALRRA